MSSSSSISKLQENLLQKVDVSVKNIIKHFEEFLNHVQIKAGDPSKAANDNFLINVYVSSIVKQIEQLLIVVSTLRKHIILSDFQARNTETDKAVEWYTEKAAHLEKQLLALSSSIDEEDSVF
eukprot:GCRY01002317.1.p1 GENE.GCRY01002317.1~~GCRY01002317.1.p1  ORF type:complete len:123 (+),score=27.62 GCRY01002317.1:310-678(+)